MTDELQQWEEEFLDWLDEQDGHRVSHDAVRDEWPTFLIKYDMGGVTGIIGGDGQVLIPKQDYRDTLYHGGPLD